MKKNCPHLLLPIVLGIICISQPVQAQSKVGTTIGQVLLIEPSARVAGMGNAGVAMYDEVEAAFYNPGAIGRMERNGVQFTHSLWLADIEYNYVGASIRAGDVGNIYLSMTSLNSGEIEVTTVEQPLGTGERYSVNDFALGLGFGRQMTDRFSVGLQANYYKQTIWHNSISTIAFNVGSVYCLSANGLRIGASLSNFGVPASYDGRDLRLQHDLDPNTNGGISTYPAQLVTDKFSLPVFFRVGIGLPVNLNRSNSLLVSVDAFHPSDNTESVSLGAEWNFLDVFSLRGGYQNLYQKDSEVGMTFGAGLNYDFSGYTFKFDYAWADYGRLENTQRFTLGVTF